MPAIRKSQRKYSYTLSYYINIINVSRNYTFRNKLLTIQLDNQRANLTEEKEFQVQFYSICVLFYCQGELLSGFLLCRNICSSTFYPWHTS